MGKRVGDRAGRGRAVWALVRDTFSEWSNDKAARLGASLAYYTVFSLAPVLVLVIAVAGFFLGPEAARGELVTQFRGLLGNEAATVIEGAIAKAGASTSRGVVATIVGVVTLIIGATGVMVELQDSLDTIWKVTPKPGSSVRKQVRVRLLSLALVLSFGFVLLVSLVASAVLSAVGGYLGSFVPGWVVLGQVLNNVVAIGVVALFFALIFKLLPDAKIAWRDVWVGALVTSALFHVGKLLIGLYLGRATVASTFGAAGSLAVMLVWVYYSAQIVLLGAEFTRLWADRYGSRVLPAEHAVRAPSDQNERRAVEAALEEAQRGQRPPEPRTT